jgi:hypothetical protein
MVSSGAADRVVAILANAPSFSYFDRRDPLNALRYHPQTMTDDSGNPPPFDRQIADSYLGKYILVGITYLDHEGNETRRMQLHGVVEKAGPDGITVTLRGVHEGESWTMPPDPRAISAADTGSYTLHSTGESIENPDLLATWTIQEPPPTH